MTRSQGSISRGIVLLRRSNGSRVLDTPRDMPGYRGDGPAETLALVLDRLGAQTQAAWDRAVDLETYEELQQRSARLAKAFRELRGESEAA
jgi:glutamate/tyrosine decarboxylase-like PLP-dependent enzyme